MFQSGNLLFYAFQYIEIAMQVKKSEFKNKNVPLLVCSLIV